MDQRARRARVLAQTVYGAFNYMPDRGGRRRAYWKMSIDLSRPLVPLMGQHDPLDAARGAQLMREGGAFTTDRLEALWYQKLKN